MASSATSSAIFARWLWSTFADALRLWKRRYFAVFPGTADHQLAHLLNQLSWRCRPTFRLRCAGVSSLLESVHKPFKCHYRGDSVFLFKVPPKLTADGRYALQRAVLQYTTQTASSSVNGELTRLKGKAFHVRTAGSFGEV